MNSCLLCGEPSGSHNTCNECADRCRECTGAATGEDGLCEDCRVERDDNMAVLGWYISDSGEVLDIEPRADDELSEETQPTPVEDHCQAWIEVDGQRVTPDDVRRMANLLQKTRWAWILSGIAENKAQQIIRRLEYELSDCGDAPTYSITPKGYEMLRDMAV